jgi:hypothetical protein
MSCVARRSLAHQGASESSQLFEVLSGIGLVSQANLVSIDEFSEVRRSPFRHDLRRILFR